MIQCLLSRPGQALMSIIKPWSNAMSKPLESKPKSTLTQIQGLTLLTSSLVKGLTLSTTSLARFTLQEDQGYELFLPHRGRRHHQRRVPPNLHSRPSSRQQGECQ